MQDAALLQPGCVTGLALLQCERALPATGQLRQCRRPRPVEADMAKSLNRSLRGLPVNAAAAGLKHAMIPGIGVVVAQRRVARVGIGISLSE